jgi:hypothetical protein
MMKRAIAATALGLALVWASPAAAETVSFDYNGTSGGGAFLVDTFDWLPGNSLLVEDGTVVVNGTTYMHSWSTRSTGCRVTHCWSKAVR